MFACRSNSQSDSGTAMKCCLLESMSRVTENEDMRVVLIATTNSPDYFDPGFLRRFYKCVYVRLPDRATILAIMRFELAAYELDVDVTVGQLHKLATEMSKRRTLSGDDVHRAMGSELKSLILSQWRSSTWFREVSTEERVSTHAHSICVG